MKNKHDPKPPGFSLDMSRLERILGNADAAQRWMMTRAAELGGQTPHDLFTQGKWIVVSNLIEQKFEEHLKVFAKMLS